MSQLLQKMDYSAIAGWNDARHADALTCFLQGAKRMINNPHSTKSLGADGQAIAAIAREAAERFANNADISNDQARAFFEENFQPFNVCENGFVTGYFEPELPAALEQSDEYPVPLYRRPLELVDIDDDTRPPDMDPYFMFAQEKNGKLSPYYNRHAINQGALAGRGLEIFWLKDQIDCFFLHIQGSARLLLADGTIRKISYAAKSGHPYTSIGKYLADIDAMPIADITMDSIKNWLKQNPQRMMAVMEQNQSYIFFQETSQPDPDLGPIAAAGVALTSGVSLAIDHKLHTFGTPVFVTSNHALPGDKNSLSRLMIAQDTGSAIVGAARGDIFIGSGTAAGTIAGAVKFEANFVALLPRQQGVSS